MSMIYAMTKFMYCETFPDDSYFIVGLVPEINFSLTEDVAHAWSVTCSLSLYRSHPEPFFIMDIPLK